MIRTNATWIATIAAVFALSAAPSADAARTPTRTTNRTARATRAKPRSQTPRAKNKVPAQKFYKGDPSQPMPTFGKTARTADWTEGRGYTVEGTKSAFKDLYKGATERYEAAAMYVIPKKGIKQTVLKDQGEYGSNQSLEVKVTGLGKSGKYSFDFLGSVSTHNEGGNHEGAALKTFIANRVKNDGVKLTHILPDGSRKDIVTNHPSDIVTHLSKSVDLKPGKNIIRYERTDRSSGRIVSAQGLYSEWRTVVIHWDGN